MGDKLSVRTSPGLWIVLALMVLLLPLPWFLALTVSSLIHELWHLAAIRMTGVEVIGLRLGADGAYLETTPMNPFQSLVCSLSGPLGALTLLLFARWMPRTALCAAAQSCYHLLPVQPLDGGRALESLTDYLGWSPKICFITEMMVLSALVLSGVYLMTAGLGMLPLILTFAIIFRTCREKYLANGVRTEYNISTK